MPDLDQSIFDGFAGQDVMVFGLYGTSEDPGLIVDFQEQIDVGFPLIRDEARTLQDFAFPPGVGFPYPRDVVIGKDLTVRSIRNSFDADEAEALVERLLLE